MDGQCLEYHHEERFSNVKNHSGFPYLALDHLTRLHGNSILENIVIPHEGFMPFLMGVPSQDHDYEQISPPPGLLNLRKLFYAVTAPMPLKLKLKLRGFLRSRLFANAHHLMLQKLSVRYGVKNPSIRYVDHHTSHALTPVYFYGLSIESEPTLLITADGAGGDACSKVFIFDPQKNKAQKIAHSYYPASLGYLYLYTTQYLGMKPGEHEYKVMGLAAYSTDSKYWNNISDQLKRLVRVNEDRLTLESTIDMSERLLPVLKRIFDEQRFDNIAAAVQNTLEERIQELAIAAVKKTGISRVAFSGGVFMNVKMNQRLTELSALDRVYFQPSCADESLGIGGAADEFLRRDVQLKPIRTMYTGVEHSERELENLLNSSPDARGLVIERPPDIESKIAELLAEFEIVARFAGRGEWGARSLCNRGILANARDLKSFYTVNDMVKMRDFWMPFAPTILFDWGARYIENWKTLESKARESSKYMILTVSSTPLAQDHLRAAIHQKDKTLRPQMLEEHDNPALFKILKSYEKLTGMGGVMNTSFNLHGSPLVGSPTHALATFAKSGLRRMALGPFLVSKK